MVTRDIESLSALGRALSNARDGKVISKGQFTLAARALAVAMLTGTMEMEAYAGIHWVLGQMLESAFSSPSKVKQEDLDTHVETVGRIWSYVGPEAESLKGVDRFFSKVFDMDGARFLKETKFLAPMKASTADAVRLMKAAGIKVISSSGQLPEKPSIGILTDFETAEGEPHLKLGWGDRETALVLVP